MASTISGFNRSNMAPDKAWRCQIFVVFFIIFLFCEVYGRVPDLTNVFSSKHTNNWAVIVRTLEIIKSILVEFIK